MIRNPWPDLQVLARSAGPLHPYDPANRPLFRGEEAFAPHIVGWRRWSKPSPEPPLDDGFAGLLLRSIRARQELVAALVERLTQRVLTETDRAPLLLAILRAGVPVGHLLARRLERHYGEPVPLVAISLFQKLGWDDQALAQALALHPDRPIWFVDGWTSRGGVARELRSAHQRWCQAGRPDFTAGRGPRLAVLLDPRGQAQATASRQDLFIPSACFTAPETLGFSRSFATEDGGMFRVYLFPPELQRPELVRAWTDIAQVRPAALPEERVEDQEPLPPGWRLHINEVVRALINRDPQEIFLRASEDEARRTLAPVLHLCQLRGVPVRYGRQELCRHGAAAIARMR